MGQVSTSATTEVAVNATTYNEQTSGAQRSLKSGSANDTAAGTGARTVRVMYYTLVAGVIAGPFFESVTMNGATAVATVATNIALIERLEVMTAGSGGVAAGVITLYTDNAGAGSAVCSIAALGVRTMLSHHYVPTGKQSRIVDVQALGGDAAAAVVQAKSLPYPSGIEKTLTGAVATTATEPANVSLGASVNVVGPARVRLTVTPANGNAQTTYGSFGWVDAP